MIADSETDGRILALDGNTQCELKKRFLISLIDPKDLRTDEEIEEIRSLLKPEEGISVLDDDSVLVESSDLQSWLSLGYKVECRSNGNSTERSRRARKCLLLTQISTEASETRQLDSTFV